MTKQPTKPAKGVPCKHESTDLGYMAALHDAQRRMRNNERQLNCPICGKWEWESNYTDPTGAMTARQFDAAIKRSEADLAARTLADARRLVAANPATPKGVRRG